MVKRIKSLEKIELLSPQDTAEFLHVDLQKVNRLIRDKQIDAIRVGGEWRIEASSLYKLTQKSSIHLTHPGSKRDWRNSMWRK